MRLLIALAFAAPLCAQTCTVNPLSFSFDASTHSDKVRVGQGCGSFVAVVSSQSDWLHVTDSGGGIAPADVIFNVAQNLSALPRSGTMTIAGQTVTVTQSGANCTFSVAPTTQAFPVTGGTNTLKVSATCPWQVAANQSWIAFTGSGAGNLDGTVAYSVAANTCASARTGTIALQTNLPAPPTLVLTEDGSPDNISLSANSATVAAAASTGFITVSTGDSCFWNLSSDVSWIQITLSTGNPGGGRVSYRLLENTGAQRIGSIHVGALTYSITQLPPGPPPAVLASVGNAADYRTDAVSPGEIVSLFGTDMGPAAIVTLQLSNGAVTNNLAGTQVLFDGVPAPMIFTLKGQVSAVVPYAVAGKSTTKVQIQYQGVPSNAMTVPVQAATPAIFSLDTSGRGPGAILNQDLSINTTGNPATPLSIIALYCTGGGVTTPASSDGAVIGDASFVLAQTPVVTIGGVNAVVKYAGAAPFSVAGLTQINVEVPAAVTPGIALPVIVRMGDFASSAGVTVAVAAK